MAKETDREFLAGVSARLVEWVGERSQYRVAKDMGVSPATFWHWSNGRKLPSAEKLAVMARMGCDVNWLLTGERR